MTTAHTDTLREIAKVADSFICGEQDDRYRALQSIRALALDTLADSKAVPADELRAELKRRSDWMQEANEKWAGTAHFPRRDVDGEALAALDQQAEIARDAERYRWLRDKWFMGASCAPGLYQAKDVKEIDAAIDAALIVAKEPTK